MYSLYFKTSYFNLKPLSLDTRTYKVVVIVVKKERNLELII